MFTTYRLTELHCGGISTRVMPHTAELQPEAFVEISPELAEELGIGNLDWTVLSTARGEIEVKALVTERMRPFIINGKHVHQVGMPWVFGWEGYAHGDIANVLLAIHGDPNTSIHTTKALTCALRKGRLPEPEPWNVADEPARAGPAAIDKLLVDRPEKFGHDFSKQPAGSPHGVTDYLAGARRSAEQDRQRLERLNAAISVMLGGQFPWEREMGQH